MTFIKISYTVHDHISTLSSADIELIEKAGAATELAYAPYSNFRVGASARLSDGQIILGSNQENASFPAGICAERVLLSTVSSIAPGKSIETMAICCESELSAIQEPVAPCGICRQSLVEFESRLGSPIRLLLVGSNKKVLEFMSAAELLPFAFTPNHLGK